MENLLFLGVPILKHFRVYIWLSHFDQDYSQTVKSLNIGRAIPNCDVWDLYETVINLLILCKDIYVF